MSKENLVKLIEAAAADEQLGQKLQSASSYEQVKSLARQQGFDLGDLSEEEAQRTVGVMTGAISEELTDEELEMVAGGLEIEQTATYDRVKLGRPSRTGLLDYEWIAHVKAS